MLRWSGSSQDFKNRRRHWDVVPCFDTVCGDVYPSRGNTHRPYLFLYCRYLELDTWTGFGWPEHRALKTQRFIWCSPGPPNSLASGQVAGYSGYGQADWPLKNMEWFHSDKKNKRPKICSDTWLTPKILGQVKTTNWSINGVDTSSLDSVPSWDRFSWHSTAGSVQLGWCTGKCPWSR